MTRDCEPDLNTSERLASVQAAEKCLIPCWPLRQTALWRVKNAVLSWSRKMGSRTTEGTVLSQLPLQVRQELLDSLVNLRPDGREVMCAIKHLVKGGIVSFDLGCLDECHHYDVRQVIKLLMNSGHTVRRIAIRGQWLFDSDNQELLSDLLKSLTNVEHLCLQETCKNAHELDIILANCSKLHTLEISQPSLNDSELSVFSSIQTQLLSLKVPSSVRGNGLCTLLRIFPNLQNLECSHLDELLDCLDSSQETSWWRERALGLRCVRTSHPIGADSLRRLVSWCPNLHTLSVEIQEGVDLNPVVKLQNLKFLELKNSAVLPVSYDGKVLNLVKAVGPRLLRLSLDHFDTIDLTQLSDMCRELESLELRWFTTLNVSRTPKGLKPFCRMTSLCVRPRTNQHVNREACKLLLSWCTEMEKLEMYCCYGLDDALLKHVLKTNPLDQLRVLYLRHGHGVTGAGLKMLVGKSTKMESWDFGAFTTAK